MPEKRDVAVVHLFLIYRRIHEARHCEERALRAIRCLRCLMRLPSVRRSQRRLGMTSDVYPTSAKRGARFSMLARTASIWLGPPISFICSTDFGEQRRTGIDGKIVQHALGGADRVGTFAGDLARDLERSGSRVVADPRGQPITQGLLRREDPPGIGQLAQDIVAHEARQDRRPRHVRHQPPFDLHDRHPRIGGEKAHVGAERELKAAAERHALDRGDHRHRKLPPAPHRLLAGNWPAHGCAGRGRAFRRPQPRCRPFPSSRRTGPCRGRRRTRGPRRTKPPPGGLFRGQAGSEVATSASNIAASSAFILSARTRRTSATPSEIDTETRSFHG